MRSVLVGIACVLSACSSTGVVPSGDDTLMIAKRSAQVGLGPPVKTEAAVYAEASAYCESRQKLVETVDKEVRNSVFGRPGSVNLKFRCVDAITNGGASSAEAPADTVTADDSRSDTGMGDAETDDLYSRILKLDDLRQRGLITDEEYEQEKKELLEEN